MPLLDSYSVIIFDCDGVILNSNELKISAMQSALEKLNLSDFVIKECVEYFKTNFGKSRFHHVRYFVDNICDFSSKEQEDAYSFILQEYSSQCYQLYLNSELTDGFEQFVKALSQTLYVASGSLESELREVFKHKRLNKYFKEIYGSPISKSDLVRNIKSMHPNEHITMIGDATSDFEAAQMSCIDFIGYLPHSNVKQKLSELTLGTDSKLIEHWSELC